MIVALSKAGVTAQGVYPGGQSENPASPWYDDQVPLWWDGRYLPVPVPGRPAGSLTWTLTAPQAAAKAAAQVQAGAQVRAGAVGHG
jgi:hypothetical protein